MGNLKPKSIDRNNKCEFLYIIKNRINESLLAVSSKIKEENKESLKNPSL